MPRNIPESARRAINLGRQRTNVRVQVRDTDGTYQDLTNFRGRNWVVGGSVRASVDQQTITATIELRRSFHQLSLAPLNEVSRLNISADGTLYDPILQPGAAIVVDVMVLPMDANLTPASGDWVQIFNGNIDRVDSAADPIRIECRDFIGAAIQDRWVEDDGETAPTYGSDAGTLVGEVIEDILTDWVDAGIASQFYEPPSASTFACLPFKPEVGPVADRLQSIVDQFGWILQPRYDDGTSSWRLTLYDPLRTKTTPDITYAERVWIDLISLTQDITQIRNVVQIEYRDIAIAEDENDASGGRRTVTATDAGSVTQVGRRWMHITEDDASNIDTNTEAQAMADAILADLVAARTMANGVLPLDPRVQLADLLRFEADGVRFTDDQDLAVLEYTHEWGPTGSSTKVQLRGAPMSAERRWLNDVAARPGGGRVATHTAGLTGTPTVTSVPGGVEVTVPFLGLPRLNGIIGWYEVHEDTGSFSGTPNEDTLRWRGLARTARISGPPGEERTYKTIAVTVNGDRITSPPSERTGTAPHGYAGPQFLDPFADFGGHLESGFSVLSRGSTFPPDGWNMETGSWTSNLPTPGVSVASVSGTSESGRYSLALGQAAGLISRLFPVREFVPMRLETRWWYRFGSGSADHTIQLELNWFSDESGTAGVLISTEDLTTSGADMTADGIPEETWFSLGGVFTPPTNARFARLRVAAGDDPDSLDLVGRVEMQRTWETFHGYLESDDTMTNNTWEQIQATGEAFDHGAIYDNGSYEATIRAAGVWEFIASAEFDNADVAIGAMIQLNGSPIAVQAQDAADVSEWLASARVSVSTGPILVARGDTVSAYARGQRSSGSPTLVGGTNQTYFKGIRRA